MAKQFSRDSQNKMLGGVVAGFRRSYLPDTDLLLLRVGLAALTVLTFWGPIGLALVVSYVMLWVLAPEG